MIITKQGFGHFEDGKNNQDLGFESVSRAIFILDGCSGAEYPEVGTRLFAQIFKRKEDWDNANKFEENVKETFNDIIAMAEKVFTDDESMDNFIFQNLTFTIIACFKTDDEYIVKIFGDGFVVTENKYGLISYIRFFYGDCPPYYAKKFLRKADPELPISEFVTLKFSRKVFPKIAIATDGIAPFAKGLIQNKDEAIINCMSVSINSAISRYKLDDDVTIAIFDDIPPETEKSAK